MSKIKELFSSTRPQWITESTWRGWRTFYQTFGTSVAVAGIAVLTTYANGGTFDLNYLWLQGVIAGLAGALAKAMNANKDNTTE